MWLQTKKDERWERGIITQESGVGLSTFALKKWPNSMAGSLYTRYRELILLLFAITFDDRETENISPTVFAS